MHHSQPIGIFDSGVGGLTVAQAVLKKLPHENLVYVGDTKHLPYGDKSADSIVGYCKRIVDFLLKKECKVILIACNSATAAAKDILLDYINGRAHLVDVVAPVISQVITEYPIDKKIGLIGTRQTIRSHIYQHAFEKNQRTIYALETPILVPLIEEGFTDTPLMLHALQHYFSTPNLSNLDALILGCTHYPLIKDVIHQSYPTPINIIDATQQIAIAIDTLLTENNLHHLQNNKGNRHFYVSDLTDNFTRTAQLFFGQSLQLEQHSL